MKTDSLKDLMQCPRQFASLILAGMFILLLSSAAMAQTPAPPQQPDKQQTTYPSPESPPIPERSLGLEPGKVVQWTVHDAILAALENNVDLELEKSNVRNAQWQVVSAQGYYDPLTRSGIGYTTSSQPNVQLQQFSGTTDTSTVNNTYSYSYGFQQAIEKTGGVFNVDFNNSRLSNNYADLAVNYQPTLNFQITQPLFRNFKTDSFRNSIKIYKKQLDVSDAQFRQRVIEIITNVVTAYWQLYVAYENEKISRASLALAEKQMNDTKRQVEVGTQAPINIINAATLVENDRASVYGAINQVAAAENALKVLVVDGPGSDLWKSKIETIQKFEVSDVKLPVEDAIALAMTNRYELKRYNLTKEYQQYNIDYWRNQSKPQINFVANYGLTGVGGTPRDSITANCSNPMVINGNKECISLGIGTIPDGSFVPVVNQTDYKESVQPSPIADNFQGGYGTSLRNLFNNSFRNWSVGFQFQLPLRNRVAKANLAMAREAEKSTDLTIRQQMQTIEAQVRNALQNVDTSRQRIDSTRKASEYAQLQYEGAQKSMQAGLITIFEVLTRQNDLVQAQVAENNAKSDYAQAVANLELVLSTSDVANNIQIPEPKQPIK